MNASDICAVYYAWRSDQVDYPFITEATYMEAIEQFETINNQNLSFLLEIPAIVIANACVSYIMMTQNEKA